MPPDSPKDIPASDPVDPDATLAMEGRIGRLPGVESPGDLIGRYRLIEPLGQGGFGSVWRAEQHEPIHREVALKVIKAGMDSVEIITRFEAERQALALMDHPNIAALLDAGTTENGRPFFVMELVKGVPVTRYCDEHHLTIRQRIELFILVCQAVQHAHQKTILHRDLKPSNILVMEVDGKPVPKVIDFGIAKALDVNSVHVLHAEPARTIEGMVVGTPQYMSPEQAGSMRDVDTRSDIYTLGVILYELLTGESPLGLEQLKRAALDELLRLIREGETLRPSSRFTQISDRSRTAARFRNSEPKKLGEAIRGDLDWIVIKALEKNRSRRYETANALALDLQRHLHDEPVSAGPPSAGYRLKKLVRRNKVVFATAAAVLLALAAGLVIALRGEAKVESMLTRMQLQRAEELLEKNDASGGLAYLAAVLRRHPDDKITAARLLSALRDRSHARLIAGPWQGKDARVVKWEAAGDAVHLLADGQLYRWRLSEPRPDPTPMLQTEGEKISDPPTYSPDGSKVLCFHGWAKCRFYELESGKPLTPPLEKEEGWAGGLSPHESAGPIAKFTPDGQRAAVIWTSNFLYVWDASTGTKFKKLAGDPTHVDFHPDGKTMAMGLRSGELQLWDISGPEWVVRQQIPFSTRYIHRVQFVHSASNNKLLLQSGSSVMLYELEHGVVAGGVSFQNVTCLDLLPSAGLMVIGQNDHRIKIVSVASGGDKNARMIDVGGYVKSISLSSDGLRVLVEAENALQVWSIADASLICSSRRMPSSILSDRFSRPTVFPNPDGTAVAVAQNEGTLSFWQTGMNRALPVVMPMRGSSSESTLHPAGDWLATSNKEGRQAAVWELDSGQRLSPVMLAAGRNCNVEAIAFQPGTDRLWIGVDRLEPYRPKNAPTELAVPWNWRTGRRDGPGVANHANEAFVWGLKFSKDGARLEVNRSGAPEPVYDTSALAAMKGPWDQAGKMWFSHLADSGEAFLQVTKEGARRWDLRTGQSDSPLFGGPTGLARLETSRECEACVIVSDDNSARVWDARKGVPKGVPIRHLDLIRDSSLLLSSDFFSTASDDKTARLWSISTGESLGLPMRHHESVYSVDFSPEGRRLSTASFDGTTRLWHVPSGRPLTEPLKVFGQFPSDASWHPDGRRLLTTGRSPAQCWDTPPVEAAAPYWLPDWAEAVGGFRLDEEGEASPLPLDSGQRFVELASKSSDDDVFSRSLHWFYQSSGSRPISPEAAVTTQDWAASMSSIGERSKIDWALAVAPDCPHVWLARWWEENQMEPLRYPENPTSWLAYCWQGADESVLSPPLLKEQWRPVFSRIASSELVQNRYAAHGLLLRAAMIHEPNPAEAATLCRDALKAGLEPVWQSRARIMLSKLLINKLDQADEAARLLGEALGALTTEDREQINDERQEQMILRRTALQRSGDVKAMAADNTAFLNLPKRNPDAPAECLDLTAFYTQSTVERIQGPHSRGSFTEMPSGLRTFEGVLFDARGIILMRCRQTDFTTTGGYIAREDPGQPSDIAGIPVGAACRKLHFLHTGIETGYVPKGRLEIGSYVVRYEDGTELTIPVRRGHELADHQRVGDKKLGGRLAPHSPLHQIAWQGQDEWSRSGNPDVHRHTCAYLYTWTNPKPQVPIKSLEIHSDSIGGSFATFAITLE